MKRIPIPSQELVHLSDMAIDGDQIWLLAVDDSGNSRAWVVDVKSGQFSNRSVPLGGPADSFEDVAIGEGFVWVTVFDQSRGSGNALLKIDPSARTIVARFAVRDAFHVTAGGGAVWLSSDKSILALDPRSGKQIDIVRLDGEAGMLWFADGALWAERGGGDGALIRVDPKSRVVKTVLPGRMVYAIGEGGLWAAGNQAIERFDLSAGRFDSRRIPLAIEPPAVAVGEGSVWVFKFVYQEDLEPASPPPPLGHGPRPMSVVTWQIDPETFDPLTEQLVLPGSVPQLGLAAIAGGFLWVAPPGGSDLLRISADC